jgi:transposase-like protein
MSMDKTEGLVCAEAYNNGSTIRDLADRYGISPAVVRAELRRLGVKFRAGPPDVPPARARLRGRPQAKATR